MNVTVEMTGNPIFPWRVSSECRTLAEATAKATRIETVDPLAFLPTYGAGIAIADGEPATGGGGSSQTMLDGGEFATALTPAQEALIEYAEAADSATDTLTPGEAYKPEAMS